MPDERADEPIGQEEPRIRLESTWVNPRAVLALHDRQLAEHGGGVGLRDAGALDSALARPRNR